MSWSFRLSKAFCDICEVTVFKGKRPTKINLIRQSFLAEFSPKQSVLTHSVRFLSLDHGRQGEEARKRHNWSSFDTQQGFDVKFSRSPADLKLEFVELISVLILVDPQVLSNSAYEIEYEQKVVDLSISGGLTGALISKIWLRVCD